MALNSSQKKESLISSSRKDNKFNIMVTFLQGGIHLYCVLGGFLALIMMIGAGIYPYYNFSSKITSSYTTLGATIVTIFIFITLVQAPMKHQRNNNDGSNVKSKLNPKSSEPRQRIIFLFKRNTNELRGISFNISQTKLIRFLFLCYYSSLGCLLPYLPIYYHSLGFNGAHIGYLGAIKPLTTFLLAPLWGILSDNAKNSHSTILMVTFTVGLLCQLSMCIYDTSFVWLVSTVFLASIFNAPVKSLMDSMVMNTLPKDNKSDYGKTRLWGQLGSGLGSSMIGFLLSQNNVNNIQHLDTYSSLKMSWYGFHAKYLNGYKIAFFAHFIWSLPTYFILRTFQRMERQQQKEGMAGSEKSQQIITIVAQKDNAEQESNKKQEMKYSDSTNKIIQGLQHLSNDNEAKIFFGLVLLIGLSSGITENFSYVRIREIGGTGNQIGLSRILGSISGLPLFWFSGKLVGDDSVIYKGLKEETLFSFCLLSYSIRCFIYAHMTNPLLGIPAEILKSMVFAIFWSTGTIYANKISPDGMNATMVSLEVVILRQT